MAIKPKAKSSLKTTLKPALKSSPKTEEEADQKPSVLEARTLITFRTKQLTKKKAEKVLGDLGISMSSALNMFLTQVVHDEGMPFLPTAQKKGHHNRAKDSSDASDLGAFEDLWEEL